MYTTVYNSTISLKKTVIEACTFSSLCRNMRYFIDPVERNCSIHNQIQVKVTNPIQSEGLSHICFSCTHVGAKLSNVTNKCPALIIRAMRCHSTWFLSTGLDANPHRVIIIKTIIKTIQHVYLWQCCFHNNVKPVWQTDHSRKLAKNLDWTQVLDWTGRDGCQSHAKPFSLRHIHGNTGWGKFCSPRV